jgi:hypothetical protein
MTTIPTFKFCRATSGSREFPREFLTALAETRRFYRNSIGKVLFLVNTAPDEFIELRRTEEFRSIIEDASVIRLTGDAPNDDDYKALFYAVLDHRWRLPGAGSRTVGR